MRVVRALTGLADALKTWAIGDSERWRTAVSKVLHQYPANGGDVATANAQAGGGGTNLGDEVADFVGVEGHEAVDARHARVTHVRGKSHHAVAGTAQELAEELVKMGQKATGKRKGRDVVSFEKT